MGTSWRDFRKTGSVDTGEKLRKLGLLVVDDEEQIVASLRDVFASSFDIYSANSPEEGLRLFRELQPKIVLCDQRMPSMTGIELLRLIKDINPDTVRILVTGHSDIDVVVTALNEGLVWKYVSKPWSHDDLKKIVMQGAGEYLRKTGEDPGGYSFMDA
jgi:response regulator RpfG family c-di-GMP phosphodiesterase